MKKLCIIACLALGLSVTAYAQHPVNSFFDDLGSANIHTEDLVTCIDANGRFRNDTIVKVFHRLDDVVWAKYVYSVIDLRYRQNYQLYFPTNITDSDYRNLFKVMVDAIRDGLPVYDKIQGRSGVIDVKPLKPDFTKPLSKEDIVKAFIPNPMAALDELRRESAMFSSGEDDEEVDEPELDSCFLKPECTEESFFQYDSINDSFIWNPYPYDDISKNIYKYLIQEIVFFDKHTSRLHRKILAIAPLYPKKLEPTLIKYWQDVEGISAEPEAPEKIENGDIIAPEKNDTTDAGSEASAPQAPKKNVAGNAMKAMYQSLIFWIPFDAFRPYLANQYVIPMQNEVKRVTFDEFFQKHLYTSYIIGDGNMYNKNILDFRDNHGDDLSEEAVKKEQQRIQTEMLNLSQDLWEY